jgi:tryptophan synthase alpha chain
VKPKRDIAGISARSHHDRVAQHRLDGLFTGRPPVIPFLTAGFPSPSIFHDAALAAHEAGAGALEIGMPFSDPLADGPAIQHASRVALERGVTLHHVLEMTAALRAAIPIPIFLMGYLNPILNMGFGVFAQRAREAGADGTIIPDCPPEEAGDWMAASRSHDLDNVYLIAPTSSADRIRRIDHLSTHFSYCVAVTGVTGVRTHVTDDTKRYLRRVRRVVRKPFVVGFGIGRPEHVRALAGLADGFVVGSTLVSLLETNRSRAAAAVGRLVAALVRVTPDGPCRR